MAQQELEKLGPLSDMWLLWCLS